MNRPTLFVPLLAAGLALAISGCASAGEPTTSSSATPSPSTTSDDAAEFTPSTLADLCSTAIIDDHESNPAYDDIVAEPELEEARAAQLDDGSWAVAIPITQTNGGSAPVEASWMCTVTGTPDDATVGIRAESLYVVDDNWLDEVEKAMGGEE